MIELQLLCGLWKMRAKAARRLAGLEVGDTLPVGELASLGILLTPGLSGSEHEIADLRSALEVRAHEFEFLARSTETASIIVRVVRETDNPLPAYETADSAGLDLRAHLGEPLRLMAGHSALVSTGLRFEIPTGYEGQVRPRSGLALKRGLTVLNAPGTIDADYRGDVGVLLINHSQGVQVIEHGDRIAQIVFAPVARAAWIETSGLSGSSRSEGGFGSTGER